MPNYKKRSKSKDKARKLASQGIAALNEFYTAFTPSQAEDELWELFMYSMICPDRNEMSTEERSGVFFFYEKLKDLIRGGSCLVGTK